MRRRYHHQSSLHNFAKALTSLIERSRDIRSAFKLCTLTAIKFLLFFFQVLHNYDVVGLLGHTRIAKKFDILVGAGPGLHNNLQVKAKISTISSSQPEAPAVDSESSQSNNGPNSERVIYIYKVCTTFKSSSWSGFSGCKRLLSEVV